MKLSQLLLLFLTLLLALPAAPQNAALNIAASAPTAVPPLIPYSGAVNTLADQRSPANASVTFLIYKDEQGGEPVFAETQTVAVDVTGHYKAQLGATLANGIPLDLFANGEARWLEVQIPGQSPQPRVLIASVPYALKAADASTLGGLPASAFARTPSGSAAAGVTPEVNSTVTTPGGTAGYLSEFSGAATIVDSPVFILGSDVGIGTTTPTATLDVNGTALISGALSTDSSAAFGGAVTIEAAGKATAAAGASSHSLGLEASSYNSGLSEAVAQTFQFKAVPVGNDTATASATLEVLFGQGTATPAATGLEIAANGTLHFAPGQTFSGGALTGVVNATGYDLGGSSFATGSTSGGNAYLGFAGNTSSSGTDDTGVGYKALSSNTSGSFNTANGLDALFHNTTGSDNAATGYKALYANTTGSNNTASGHDALQNNSTGGDNTAVGYLAGPGSGSTGLTNSTALGANAIVSQSNTLVLGQTTAGSPGASFVNVGIGTAKPVSALEASVNVSSALGPALTLTNPGGAGGSPTNAGTAESIDFNSYLPAAEPEGSLPEARIEAVDDGFYSDNLIFLTKFVSGEFSFLQQDFTIQSNGQVAVGLPTSGTLPALTAQFTVFDTGPTGWDGIDTFGGAEVGTGISATGGDETASSSIQGGTGGSFLGGYSPGFTGEGIYAAPGDATFSEGAGDAGYFDGDVEVTGTLFAGAKFFRIDHPLDPANKYLNHTSVESSEMMNIYSGNVTTDELGLAAVKLPDWFEAENTDFRYQLTVIGGRFAQAIVSKEIANHQFTISTNASNVKVSWQVTAVRQDAYAKAHPLVVEQQKPAHERGFYQNPELYGQPAEKQTEWGRHPRQMQHMKEIRDLQRQQTRQPSSTPAPAAQHRGQPASAVNRNFAQATAPEVKPMVEASKP